MELKQRSASQTLNQESNWPITTFAHRARLAAGCATLLFSIAKSLVLTTAAPRAWLESMLAATVAYFTADLVTGIYHWAIDNYGSAQTPIFGSQIVGFQGHHHRPSQLAKPPVAYNVHIAAAAVTAVVTPINLLCSDPVFLLFVGVFAGCVMFSQQFHAWAHTPKGRLPTLVAMLQDAGIILRRADHAAHHRPPFNNSYCIVSGVWNRVLDRSKFFVALEVVVATALGHEPRSWSDTISDWSEKSGTN
ncbi:fatty acid desaturase 4, chloroplastic-like [Salvia miltiorrhiza]|uniref:fatty acid desaturase 4, chloroplastic-like n=1 Tax=Salvia miltiorrhiza TaxID=226208 RepID=UPI0025AD710F|nr:fatty acid desaturase 4, chloroplastic-like [Salvia miltiorrhiza]